MFEKKAEGQSHTGVIVSFCKLSMSHYPSSFGNAETGIFG